MWDPVGDGKYWLDTLKHIKTVCLTLWSQIPWLTECQTCTRCKLFQLIPVHYCRWKWPMMANGSLTPDFSSHLWRNRVIFQVYNVWIYIWPFKGEHDKPFISACSHKNSDKATSMSWSAGTEVLSLDTSEGTTAGEPKFSASAFGEVRSQKPFEKAGKPIVSLQMFLSWNRFQCLECLDKFVSLFHGGLKVGSTTFWWLSDVRQWCQVPTCPTADVYGGHLRDHRWFDDDSMRLRYHARNRGSSLFLGEPSKMWSSTINLNFPRIFLGFSQDSPQEFPRSQAPGLSLSRAGRADRCLPSGSKRLRSAAAVNFLTAQRFSMGQNWLPQ